MTGPPALPRLHFSGTVLPDGTEREVWIADGRLRFDRQDDADTVGTDVWMIPGLVDAHAHLALASPAPPGATPLEAIGASGAAHLAAGVLLVREPGGPNRLSGGLGPAQGMPRVQSAGLLLSPPGTYIPGLSRPAPDESLADIVEEEARISRAWVKIIGDFGGRDGRTVAHYRPTTLAVAVRRAHEAGARVAIHATLPTVITAAIEAGVDSIEHGTMLEPEHVPELARRGVALVPTLLIRDGVLRLLRAFGSPADEVAAVDAALERQPRLVRLAADAGVTVLAGTDAGMGPHGRVRDEIARLLAAGVAPEAALGAASWAARRYLGHPGIEDGAPADIVAFARDPRRDPGELARPVAVVLDGRLISASRR